MKILKGLGKKLFGIRKITWLFLCGMLVMSEEVYAQQSGGDGGPAGRGRPPLTEPVLKYGPPSSFRPPPGNCPSTPYLDCMPPVPAARKGACSPDHIKWLKENCPDVKVVY